MSVQLVITLCRNICFCLIKTFRELIVRFICIDMRNCIQKPQIFYILYNVCTNITVKLFLLRGLVSKLCCKILLISKS